ncbi:MerR family DNA-binding transcriptional regulator [Paraconexibacter sp.]|uniref:MerR family DNA-binding transcriptional regulator n=1 Tax=Paraconexibacter sp. TaxID=2949640 RepID=UPI0035656E31
MRTLKTSEAAALLNVSPNTLRAWERRFGYPKPMRSPGKHRLYTHGEVASLRDALNDGLSISSAISRARESVRADTHVLTGALAAYDLARADQAMEAALALRSLERAVEEIMLPSLDEVADKHGADSAPWAFAASWASEWLQRARRLTPAPIRQDCVLIGDATSGSGDAQSLRLRALELFTTRAGARVLTLPVRRMGGLQGVLDAHGPDAVVLAGDAVSDDEVARWAWAVRSAAGVLPVLLYHRGVRDERHSAAAGRTLDDQPSVAGPQVLHAIELGMRPDDASGGQFITAGEDRSASQKVPQRQLRTVSA